MAYLDFFLRREILFYPVAPPSKLEALVRFNFYLNVSQYLHCYFGSFYEGVHLVVVEEAHSDEVVAAAEHTQVDSKAP